MKKFLAAALLLATASGTQAQLTTRDCVVTGAANDVDLERARTACATARERFEHLFAMAAPPLRIELREQPGYRVSDVGQQALVYWPTSDALAQSASGNGVAEHVAMHWREVLPHEAMHALVAAQFFEAGESQSAAYGTPLPDWFEEAVAIWAEPLASRRLRIAQARNLPADLLVLPRILSSAHPAARNPALLAARDGAALPRDDRELWAFYPQSIAVLTFVYDAGGSEAVRQLAERLLDESTDLPTLLVGLPGMPADQAGVIAAWRAWLPASAESSTLADLQE